MNMLASSPALILAAAVMATIHCSCSSGTHFDSPQDAVRKLETRLKDERGRASEFDMTTLEHLIKVITKIPKRPSMESTVPLFAIGLKDADGELRRLDFHWIGSPEVKKFTILGRDGHLVTEFHVPEKVQQENVRLQKNLVFSFGIFSLSDENKKSLSAASKLQQGMIEIEITHAAGIQKTSTELLHVAREAK